MWLALQHHSPENYVVASGINHSVREFVEYAFDYVGLDYRKFVELDQRFYREPEKVPLCGDSTKIRAELNWKSEKQFTEVVREMVESDLSYFSGIEDRGKKLTASTYGYSIGSIRNSL